MKSIAELNQQHVIPYKQSNPIQSTGQFIKRQSTRKRPLEPENFRPKEHTRSSTSGVNVANPAKRGVGRPRLQRDENNNPVRSSAPKINKK